MAGLPGQPGRAVPQGLDRGRAARPPRAAHHAAGARPGDRRAPRGRRGTRRSTWSPTGCASCARTYGADAVAVFGGGGLTNEKAYQLGKFARVALRHQPDRLQRPLLHVVGGGRRQPGVRRSTAGCRSRSPTSSRPTSWCWSARTWPRPCRRPCATSTGSASAAARSSSSTRGARRPPSGPTCSCSRCRAPTCALALGLLHLLDADGAVDEEYVAARTTGFDEVRAVGRRLVAGAGRAGHRRARPPSCASWPTCSPSAERVMVLTARGAEQHAQGHRHRARLDQPGARARPAAARRTPATAASPARATARAGASTARRPTSCPATG